MYSTTNAARNSRHDVIQARFERDFLPRYGDLWRRLVEERAAVEKANENSENVNPSDFLQSIANKTSINLRVHSSSDKDCNCEGCIPPILEVEEGSTEMYREKNLESSQSNDGTNSPDVGRANNDSENVAGAASTPLPAELEGAFGRLSFGNDFAANSDAENLSTKGSESSGSSVVQFDISHILDTPAKGLANKSSSVSIFSETLQPQFSPVSRNSTSEHCLGDEQSSQSSESSGYQVDLSHIVRSPVQNDNHAGLDAQLDELDNGNGLKKPIGKSTTNIEKETAQQTLVIDLVNSDDSDDIMVASRNPDSDANSGTNGELVDTDEEDIIPNPKRRPRQAAKRITLHIESDDSSNEENEWKEEKSDNGEASFDSPSGSDNDEYGEKYPSSSKFARTPAGKRDRQLDSTEAFDENENPNIQDGKFESKGPSKGSFKKNREAFTAMYFDQYNRLAFQGMLSGVEVVWSKKLRTTAGLTRLKSRREDLTPGSIPKRLATIELSTKVLDNQGRLQSTLLHEMVHAAAWLVDGVSKPPHGPCFKKWAKIATRAIPGANVTTTHDYEIQYKYAWACTSPQCNFLVQRHSRSVDIKRQCCGRCRGRLVEVEFQGSKKTGPVEKTPRKRAPLSGYNLFVKENSKAVKEQLVASRGSVKVTQAEVLKECGRLWKAKKAEEKITYNGTL